MPELDRMIATGTDTAASVQVRLDATGLLAGAHACGTVGPVGTALEEACEHAVGQLAPTTHRRWLQHSSAATAGPIERVLAASDAQRRAVRERLGLRAGQYLVVTAVRRNAWISTNYEILTERLYAQLPLDQFALAPLACMPDRPKKNFTSFGIEKPLIENGLLQLDVGTDWRSTVWAADCVIGEPGPVTAWAALLGRPVLTVGEQDLASLHPALAALPPGRITRFGTAAPADQITAAITRNTAHHPALLEGDPTSPQPNLAALERWRHNHPPTTIPAGTGVLSLPELVTHRQPISAWHGELRLSDGTIIADRYPSLTFCSGDRVPVCDVASRDGQYRREATVLLDYQRITEPDQVDQAAAMLEHYPLARVISIRVGPTEAHVLTRSDAKYRIIADAPALEMLPAVLAEAQHLATRYDLVVGGRPYAVRIECLRTPAYTRTPPAPAPEPVPTPWPKPPSPTAITAALEALGAQPPTVHSPRSHHIALAGQLLTAALAGTRQRPNNPPAPDRQPPWDHGRLARLEADLAAAHSAPPDPAAPVSSATATATAIDRLLHQARTTLALRAQSWSAKRRNHGRADRPEHLDIEADNAAETAESARTHLTADGHRHFLAPAFGRPETPAGYLPDERSATALIAARLDHCPVCISAWRERVGTDPDTCARVLELARWAHGDPSEMARRAGHRLDTVSPFYHPVVGRLLTAEASAIYATLTASPREARALIVEITVHHLGLRKLLDRHRGKRHPEADTSPAGEVTGPTPELENAQTGPEARGRDGGAAMALAALGHWPADSADQQDLAVALCDAATGIVADLLDHADTADRPALWDALITATAPLGADSGLRHHLIERLAVRCDRDLAADPSKRDGLTYHPIDGRDREVHAVAAGAAVAAAATLLQWLEPADTTATERATADLRQWLARLTLATRRLAATYREGGDRPFEQHDHHLYLTEPVPDAGPYSRDNADGEALFHAAVAGCNDCCDDLLDTVSTTPSNSARFLYRVAWLIGPDQVQRQAADAAPALATASPDALTQPQALEGLLNNFPATARRTLLRQYAEATREACREQQVPPLR